MSSDEFRAPDAGTRTGDATRAPLGAVHTKVKTHPYEVMFETFKARRRMAESGQVVIRGEQRAWQTSRQGRSKYYLHIQADDVPTHDWMVFRKEVLTESGAHTHQGGLVIYVLRGHGYSVFDGVRIDWKVGDVLVLPVKPGGVEHQHFNLDPTGSSEWIAFVFLPFMHLTGSMLTQVKEQTGWQSDSAAQLPERGGHQHDAV
jgi:quercetin dioxygenase-like cupin family protein